LTELEVEKLLAAVQLHEIFQMEAALQLEEKRRAVGKPKVLPAYEFLYDVRMPNGEAVRFKVAKGGRGKGASWAIADRLLDKAHTQPSLILCTREVQNSIADSVHRLLVNRIRALGYGEFFNITQNSIKNRASNSEFLFRGLNDLTVDAVKSMEGITDVWLAEAHNVGAKSWLVLEPTIRTEGSTLYVDYNPDAETAPTNKKFTVDVPDNAIVRHLTFKDNPYFPEVLEKLRQQALQLIANARNDDEREQHQLDYNHVWLGHTRKVNKSSIFGARYQVEEFVPHVSPGKWEGPYDGADWGFSQDPTVRIRLWVNTTDAGRRRLCIEREAYGVGVELMDLPAMFDVFPDSRKVKIRADNARPETISHMKNAGFDIKAADKWKGSVEDGIAHMKGYDVIICHPRCKYSEIELRLYSYKVDRLTDDILTDIIDANNHCMDAARYALDPVIQRKKGAHLFG
jgi:phage terminase large subunit